MKLKQTIFAISALFICQIGFGQNTPNNRPLWSIKSDLGTVVTKQYALEVERFVSGRISVAAQASIYIPGRDTERRNWEQVSLVEGYYIKAGPKYYFSKEKAPNLSGFAIQAQAAYGRWEDFDNRWSRMGSPRSENYLGLLLTNSYAATIFKRIRIEPYISVGFVPTFESGSYAYWDRSVPPTAPFSEQLVVVEYRWRFVEPTDCSNYNDGLQKYICNVIAFTGGIKVGITF